MASNRFGTSTLHQRDPRSALFDSYTGDRNRTTSASPAARPGSGTSYGYQAQGSGMQSGSAGMGGYRAATPNSKGQYSDSTLSSLEDQNDAELAGISGKVKMLKELTVAIGDEIKSSSSLADSMNDRFDNTRVRLKGTMNRMLRMADRTGIPWRYWALFFLAVGGFFVGSGCFRGKGRVDRGRRGRVKGGKRDGREGKGRGGMGVGMGR